MKTRKLNHFKFVFSLIILFNLLTGCQQSFENKIEKKIISDSKTHIKVIFPLKDLTNFEWDKFYAFDSNCNQKEITNALGLEFPYYKEAHRIMVFIKDDKIAYHEENSGDKDELVFMHPDSLKFFQCRYGSSYVLVEEKRTGKETKYELTHLK